MKSDKPRIFFHVSIKVEMVFVVQKKNKQENINLNFPTLELLRFFSLSLLFFLPKSRQFKNMVKRSKEFEYCLAQQTTLDPSAA